MLGFQISWLSTAVQHILLHGRWSSGLQQYQWSDVSTQHRSSKTSFKAVLLHNGNIKPSIPLGFATHMKETYDNIKQFLRCINYDQHQWQLCSDLKVIAVVIDLQGWYTKYYCFLCEWDSHARNSQYVKRDWPFGLYWSLGRNTFSIYQLLSQATLCYHHPCT